MADNPNPNEDITNLVDHDAATLYTAKWTRSSILEFGIRCVKSLFSFTKLKHMRFIFLRLPPLLLADLILLNSDYITNMFHNNSSETSLISSFALYMVSRFVLMFLLIVCLLIFTLSRTYILNIYKCITLVALPFIFTFLIDLVNAAAQHTDYINLVGYEMCAPKLVFIFLIYTVIAFLTIILYYDIYKHIIFDKHNVYRIYHELRDGGTDSMISYMEQLANEQYETLFGDARAVQRATVVTNGINFIF